MMKRKSTLPRQCAIKMLHKNPPAKDENYANKLNELEEYFRDKLPTLEQAGPYYEMDGGWINAMHQGADIMLRGYVVWRWFELQKNQTMARQIREHCLKYQELGDSNDVADESVDGLDLNYLFFENYIGQKALEFYYNLYDEPVEFTKGGDIFATQEQAQRVFAIVDEVIRQNPIDIKVVYLDE